MKPVTQSRVGWGVGNCTEATIASLLECALEDVPDLCEGMDIDLLRSLDAGARDRFDWASSLRFRVNAPKLNAWIKSRGYLWCYSYFAAVPLPLDYATTAWADLPWDEPMMLGGRNADGIGHLLVGSAGAVVWDPNPQRRGIVSCDEVGFLIPLDSPLLTEEQRAWPGMNFVLGARA